MSYQLKRTEEDTEVKKAVNKAQAYYDAQDKREWVEWVGKTLMPHLHAQIVMERADEMRAEQEQLEESRRQDEREQCEREWAEKEAELDEKEEEYIRQMNVKEIDEKRFRELVNELDLERGMALSIAEGLTTTQVVTQDEEVGESEREESAEEEPAVAEKAVESSTAGKGKRKAAPTRAKVYAETGETVSNLLIRRQYALTQSLTAQLVFECGSRSQRASPPHMNSTARSARPTRPDALGEGRVGRSSRGRCQ
jgi:hypothetical protein